MDIQPAEIIQVLSAAASFMKKPLQDGAGKAVCDLYEKLKIKLKRKAKSSEDVSRAFDALETKPDSTARASVLAEELEPFNISSDRGIQTAVKELKGALNSAGITLNQSVNVTQTGSHNSVNIAGRDLIQTKKVVRRTTFTPDDRHITSEQAVKIKELIEKLANKLFTEEGKPNFQRAYGILYGHFDISSYREILRSDFDEAISFLQQQNAINRSKLRRADPEKYNLQLCGAIYAKGKALGWDKAQILEYSARTLSLKRRIASLKSLGPNQLKKLNECIGREKRG